MRPTLWRLASPRRLASAMLFWVISEPTRPHATRHRIRHNCRARVDDVADQGGWDALGIGFSLVPPRLPDEERVLTETDSAPSGIQKEDQTIEVVDNPPPTPVPVRPVTDIRRSEGPAKVAEPWSRGTFGSAPKLDILGCDLGDPRREITLAECESQCSLERKCSAYTYQVSKKACFLKSCAVWAVTNEDFTSGLDWLAQSAVTRLGFTLKYGVDLTGGDFRSLHADTLVDCVRACRMTRNARRSPMSEDESNVG